MGKKKSSTKAEIGKKGKKPIIFWRGVKAGPTTGDNKRQARGTEEKGGTMLKCELLVKGKKQKFTMSKSGKARSGKTVSTPSFGQD